MQAKSNAVAGVNMHGVTTAPVQLLKLQHKRLMCLRVWPNGSNPADNTGQQLSAEYLSAATSSCASCCRFGADNSHLPSAQAAPSLGCSRFPFNLHWGAQQSAIYDTGSWLGPVFLHGLFAVQDYKQHLLLELEFQFYELPNVCNDTTNVVQRKLFAII